MTKYFEYNVRAGNSADEGHSSWRINVFRYNTEHK